MTYLLHDGNVLCDSCFCRKDTNSQYTYERNTDGVKSPKLEHCDDCQLPLLVSQEAAFQAACKTLPRLLNCLADARC